MTKSEIDRLGDALKTAFGSGQNLEIEALEAFQHAWAQLSEVLAGVLGHELKYGSGDTSMQKYLRNLSDKIYQRELQISIQNESLTFDEVHKAFHQLAQFDTVQKELSKTL
jgi:hypothetical protein